MCKPKQIHPLPKVMQQYKEVTEKKANKLGYQTKHTVAALLHEKVSLKRPQKRSKNM